MTRTNIELDEGLVTAVMDKYHLKTKRDAVNFALRRAAGLPLSPEFLLSLEGSGWSGDLAEMRSTGLDKRNAPHRNATQ